MWFLSSRFSYGKQFWVTNSSSSLPLASTMATYPVNTTDLPLLTDSVKPEIFDFRLVSKVISELLNAFALLHAVISSKFSRHFFNQSEVKPKPIVARACTFSRALCRLRVIRVLTGLLDCLRPFWLAKVITLVLVLRHSIETPSSAGKEDPKQIAKNYNKKKLYWKKLRMWCKTIYMNVCINLKIMTRSPAC